MRQSVDGVGETGLVHVLALDPIVRLKGRERAPSRELAQADSRLVRSAYRLSAVGSPTSIGNFRAR